MILTNIDFLIIQYGFYEFIVNRSNIDGSISFEDTNDENGENTYVNGVINYDGDLMPVFDLDTFIRKEFHIVSDSSRVAIILNISEFAELNKKKLQDVTKEFEVDLSLQKIAVLVSSQSLVKEENVHNLKIVPQILREFYNKIGLLAVNFSGDEKIRIFIDIEKILFSLMLH